jgi:hypothetical protein
MSCLLVYWVGSLFIFCAMNEPIKTLDAKVLEPV